MTNNNLYFYKIANSEKEFEQIHKLNYKTFSEEIPQHQKNSEQKLIDQFHDQNKYIICLKDEKLVGMVAIRGNRPFSLDKKIGSIEKSLPFFVKNPCEFRLLAINKELRNGRVLFGLFQFMNKYCLKMGYDIAVISGTVRQLKLYKQLGFKPFAQLTGTDGVMFQPMYLTKQTFEESIEERIIQKTLQFLPGPTEISKNVMTAFCNKPISHRSIDFKEEFEKTKSLLCKLVNCKNVQILLGTGSLANDVVAAQLSLEKGEGLILSNGEFGNRIIEQANRFGLKFEIIQKEWRESFSKKEIISKINKKIKWLWVVHSETSTGILNDIEMLKHIAKEKNIKLCLDCISSIGAIKLDLSDIFLATGVSGKGLHGLTGLSFVFHNHNVKPSTKLPKYIDLGYYQLKDSIPFSHSSNLVEALLVALENFSEESIKKVKTTHKFLKNELIKSGYKIINKENASPTIITIELPPKISSIILCDLLFYNGYQLHYESNYLTKRNWIQIACLNDYDKTDLKRMIQLLKLITAYELNNNAKTRFN
ncbi:MAG: aminotransferase class V-fold PLP-dependent enzyme [Bacteroidetes bacterium]|nr:aminotransferase class V-fold PLP-dependent enzyme [Bacteroidota bacterium]